MKNIVNYLAILVVGVVIGLYLPAGTVDKNLVKKVVDKELLQGNASAEIISVKNVGNISEVKLKVQGQEDSLYVNKDAKIFYQKIIDIDEIAKNKKKAEESNVVKSKSDKPKVELFVMSYCPFGTQAEKGYLPAVKKLGDKIDTKIKFVNYVMHPSQGEGEENLLQYCIQKEAPKKFNNYLGCFLEKGDSDGCLKKNNISKESLKTCLDETDKKYSISKNLKDKASWLNGRYPVFNIQDDLNKKYGVQGSPTLIINGQKMENVGRDANSIFKAICSSFKDAPEECKEDLSTETPSTGFGYESNGGNNTTDGGCGA